jgi:hypothetical protein
MKLEDRPRVLVWAVIVFAASTVAFYGLWSQERRRNVAYSDATWASEVLRKLGPEFSQLRVAVSTHPRAFVHGELKDQESVDRLVDTISKELGPERLDRMTISVRVKSSE